MTFAELQEEVKARGFEYLSDATGLERVKRWINLAYQELCEAEDWPFLYADISGLAPLAIADLRSVLSVNSESRSLRWLDRRVLTGSGVDLAQRGSPTYWHLEDRTLLTYPASDEVLEVRYVKVPVDLTADADVPVVPARYHDLLVDGAVVRAYKDSDNYEAMAAVRSEYDRALHGMALTLGWQNHQGAETIHAPYGGDW